MTFVIYQVHARKDENDEWGLLGVCVSPIGDFVRDFLGLDVFDMEKRVKRVDSNEELVRLLGMNPPMLISHPDWNGELVEIGGQLADVNDFFK